MNSWYYIWFMMAKVILLFALIYLVIPSRVTHFNEETKGFLDKVFISLTHSTLLVIVVTHFLVFVKLYETFSLPIFYVLAYFLIRRFWGDTPSVVLANVRTKLIIGLFDWSDGIFKFNQLKDYLYKLYRQLQHKVVSLLSLERPFDRLFPVLIIVASALIRFDHSINHAAYSTSDSYSHLIWVKFFGSNQIYHDGIYPHGYHAIISNLAKLSLMDPYWLIRFIGPLIGVLLVLSVYYFVLRVTKSHGAGIIALVIYGLVTDAQFPSLIIRQTAALPQEYATLFLFPGLYFLWLYLENRKGSFLMLYGEALAITVLVHPYTTVYLGLCSLVLTLSYSFFQRLNLLEVTKIAVVTGFTCIVSLLPFGIGMLAGKNFYQASAGYIMDSIRVGSHFTGGITSMFSKIISHNPFIDLGLLTAILLLISTAVIRKAVWTRTSVTITFSCAIIALLYRASEFGFPQITDQARAGAYLAMLLAVLYACGFAVIERGVWGLPKVFTSAAKGRFIQILLTGLCLVIIYRFTPGNFNIIPQEYDSAAENYLEISNRFPIRAWTIVAPTEQFQQVMGRGWHNEILTFVRKFSLEQAKDPKFKLPIPTEHIFLYTEKRPLHLGRVVSLEEAEMELAVEQGDPVTQYYQNPVQRAIIEAKAIRWMETYRQSHQGVSIYYEDANLKIYHLEQKLQGDKG